MVSIQANPYFFHGGDLQGIAAKLDYLHDLGATSIWMSQLPHLRGERYGGDAPSKAGYHGYGFLDSRKLNPHFGSKEDLQQLIANAKGNGMERFLTSSSTTTADVISPRNGIHAVPIQGSKPYLDRNGNHLTIATT